MNNELKSLLEKIDLKAEAGLCQMGHAGTREFLKDIRGIVAQITAFHVPTIAPPVAAGSVDTEELRRLAFNATRGPWRHTRQGVVVAGPFRKYTNGAAQSQIASFCVTSHEEDDEHQTEKQVPNALFSAAAYPDAVLAVIERAEKAEARV